MNEKTNKTIEYFSIFPNELIVPGLAVGLFLLVIIIKKKEKEKIGALWTTIMTFLIIALSWMTLEMPFQGISMSQYVEIGKMTECTSKNHNPKHTIAGFYNDKEINKYEYRVAEQQYEGCLRENKDTASNVLEKEYLEAKENLGNLK